MSNNKPKPEQIKAAWLEIEGSTLRHDKWRDAHTFRPEDGPQMRRVRRYYTDKNGKEYFTEHRYVAGLHGVLIGEERDMHGED